MRTIAFLSSKGGSGKSTLAVHTAVAAQESRERVLVIDTDAQRSASAWGEMRQSSPLVVAASATELAKVLAETKQEGITLAIVDTAPHTAPDAAKAALLADLLVIPVRPTVFDMTAIVDTIHMVKALKARGVLVLSACPSRSPQIAEAREILAGYGLPVFAGEITDRRAYARAVASGRGVTEFDAEGKAAQEIRSLWKYLKEQSK